MKIKALKPTNLKQATPVKPVKIPIAFPGKPTRTSPASDFISYYSDWGGGPVSNVNGEMVDTARQIDAEMYPQAPDCIKAAIELRAFMSSPGAPVIESAAIQICEIWADIQNMTGIR